MPMRFLIQNLLKLVSLTVAALLLLAYLASYVDPSTFRWLTFFGTAYPWFLLLNIGMGLFWAWRFNRFALYHLGLILAGWYHLTGLVGLALTEAPRKETTILVATHNLGGLFRESREKDETRGPMVEIYARFLREHGNPDILCTQETSGKFYRLLAEKMGYTYTFNQQKGTVILSRFPIETGGILPFGKTINSTTWADVRVRNQRVRVYSVHLQSNHVTGETERVLETGDVQEKETWVGVRRVVGKVGHATQIRAEQARLLRAHIDSSPYPVIVCGDFNDTPSSYVYRTVSEGLTDSFRERGLGLGTTFARLLPLLRIDYILTEPSFRVLDCTTVRDALSDHYPVLTRVEL